MKIILFLLLIFLVKTSFAQTSEADLNGKVFIGTAAEIRSADDPFLVYTESVRFSNGKVYSNILDKYSANGIDYVSEVDGRRMIALKVVTFTSFYSGIINGDSIEIEFTGEIIGDTNLSGNFKVTFTDEKVIYYSVSAQIDS